MKLSCLQCRQFEVTLSLCASVSPASVSICVHSCLDMQKSAECWGQSSSSTFLNPVHLAFLCELTVRVESPCLPGLRVFLRCSRRTTCLRWRRPWWLSVQRGCSRRPAKSSSRTVPSKLTGVPSVLVYFGPFFCYFFRQGIGCTHNIWLMAGWSKGAVVYFLC